MNKQSHLIPRFVEFIPKGIEEGVLYISEAYGTASHKCPCGCGTRIVTPLTPTDWQLTSDGSSVTLVPSIGNWSLPCQSHYWITNNEIVRARSWSPAQIAAGRAFDFRRKEEYYKLKRKSLAARAWQRVSNWFSGKSRD
jgi:hypothetical protein